MRKTKFGKRILPKIITLILSLALIFSFSISAFADDSTPPAKPDGESSDMGTPPDGVGGGNGGEQPGGDGSQPGGEQPGGNGGGQPGGSSGGVDSYTSVNEYSEDTEISGETIESTGTDENAILVSGGEVTISDSTVTRNSSDSTGGDNSSFYGVGAAILTTNGTSYISNTEITTDAKGGAGAFAYGDGVVYIADSVISTTQSTSGGIHAAGGGTLYAWNVTATTQGESAAAVRSDRGGGTMVIDGGTYTSNGTGSPAVYCTADISIKDATLVSTNSEAICIEGLNNLSLYDCDLTGSMHDDSQNDCTWTVILYQSMSGDSEVGCSTFEMQGGTLTSENGGLFYTTNTESHFYISDVDISAADDSEFFLRVTGNANQRGWGSTGSNGAQCTFTADNQVADGDIIWDSISTLDFYIVNGSTLTGAVLNDESCAGNGGSGYATLYIDADSTWVVTADSTLTNLYCEGSIVDENGKSVTITDASGNVLVSGDSDITVTVENYSDSADLSGSVEATSWDDVAVERPEQLGTAEIETTEETTTEETTIEETSADETTVAETTAEETAAEETTVAEAQTASSVSVGLIIGIIVAVIVIAGVIVLIVVKKKNNKDAQ